MSFTDGYHLMISLIKELDGVLSIGKSGGESIPEYDESDIDIFIFCDKVPTIKSRHETVMKLELAASNITISEQGGKFWGVCDFLTIDNKEICLMYFTIADMNDEIESVLNGSRLDREDEYFYPTGRCATFLSMYILYDKTSYIADMKKRLSVYPSSLAEKLYAHHINQINDMEDFTRAVARNDVLFYHATLAGAIDHFLQALFALNKYFFPSRKRSLQIIKSFQCKPINCAERLLKVVELSAGTDTLSQSYGLWSVLCKELSELS